MALIAQEEMPRCIVDGLSVLTGHVCQGTDMTHWHAQQLHKEIFSMQHKKERVPTHQIKKGFKKKKIKTLLNQQREKEKKIHIV